MPRYVYRARQADGTLTQGTLRASSEERASSLLRSHNLTPVSISVIEETQFWERAIFGGGVRTYDLILFARQSASMIRAGVPILETLRALQRQVQKERFRKILQEMIYDIESGSSLSGAMVKHPKAFSPFMLGVIRTGEASGRLTESLASIGDHLEQDYIFVRKVRSALIYPVFVLTLVVVLSFVMFTFVLPQLIDIFNEAGVQLPLPTRILIGITQFLQSFWLPLVLFVGVIAGVVYSYFKTPEGRYNFSTYALKLPILSTFFEKLYLARLTSILYVLFSSDVPTLESLALAKDAVGNRVYQRLLEETIQAIKDGASISYVWQQDPYIPPMLSSMVAVGERSGEVNKSFKEASQFFKRDVESMLEAVTVLLEPILILILGAGVGIVVAAILLPIYNLVLVL